MYITMCSTKHDTERCLRENMWNVQEAIKACLVTNPQLPLFDGLACDVPVGVPVDEASGFIPQGAKYLYKHIYVYTCIHI